MKITSAVPMLRTLELSATIAVYRDVLEFECVSQMEGWAALGKDDVEIMIALPNAHQPFHQPCFTGSLYFRADGVDAMWARVKEKAKAKVAHPIEDSDYGMREFAICDNTGYLLQFETPLEGA